MPSNRRSNQFSNRFSKRFSNRLGNRRTFPFATAVLLMASWFAPFAAFAAPVPAGGGEPGKAYLDCLAKLAGADKKAMIAACLTKDDPWLLKANVDYYSPPNFALELKMNNHCLRLVNVKVEGGTVDGKNATLNVRGTNVIQRLESTDEITEVDRSAWKGAVKLTQTAEGWRCTDLSSK